eukprot:CAMPEP_0194107846 /NCGR_PEP_ID=MMETSP0150-20130528/7647_1 /TAXON_ID=122233 /ORGANISM="Chaetoceros debilis, Strain MM31A-1" /LENGTH=526 /DNA_ID=CAMNT_0038796377 /DNA_START=112 /DNA_END=1692 /DNA_ORIENTATION=+
MSQVYSTEPQTTGRVILETSHGPIDMLLFCKECPTTCRTFLQLALDGFYDDLPFHRIMDNFLIQTGERKEIGGGGGSGSGKITEKYDAHLEKIDLNRKRLEIMPRIRFNHRCQVAWALPVDDEDILQDRNMLSSLSKQFFITMDEAPFLDTKKYVIFGTIRGDTVFNALRIGKTESLENGELVDKSNPPKIKRIRIEYHPMDDLVATNEKMIPWKEQEQEDQMNKADNDVKRRRKKRKGKRDLNVLSFGGEMEEGDGDGDDGNGNGNGGGNLFGGGAGMHSSHDSKHEKKIKIQSSTNPKIKISKRKINDESTPTISTGQKEESDIPKAEERKFDAFTGNESSAVVHKYEPSIKETKRNSNLEEKMSIQHPNPKAIENSKPTMSALELRRMKYMSKKGVKRKASQKRDDETMSKLNQFKSKMFEVKGVKENGGGKGSGRSEDNSLASRLSNKLAGETGDGGKADRNENGHGSGNSDEDRSWMRSKFKCKRHIDIETKELLSGDRRKIDDYEIIDEKRHKKSRRRHH